LAQQGPPDNNQLRFGEIEARIINIENMITAQNLALQQQNQQLRNELRAFILQQVASAQQVYQQQEMAVVLTNGNKPEEAGPAIGGPVAIGGEYGLQLEKQRLQLLKQETDQKSQIRELVGDINDYLIVIYGSEAQQHTLNIERYLPFEGMTLQGTIDYLLPMKEQYQKDSYKKKDRDKKKVQYEEEKEKKGKNKK
jgi:hypothetical protein